jgi:hypothetical protein
MLPVTVRRCGLAAAVGLMGRAASESGRLRHGDGAEGGHQGRGDRLRMSFVLPTLKTPMTRRAVVALVPFARRSPPKGIFLGQLVS